MWKYCRMAYVEARRMLHETVFGEEEEGEEINKSPWLVLVLELGLLFVVWQVLLICWPWLLLAWVVYAQCQPDTPDVHSRRRHDE